MASKQAVDKELASINTEVTKRNLTEINEAANVNSGSAKLSKIEDLGSVYSGTVTENKSVDGKVYESVPQPKHLKDESLEFKAQPTAKLPNEDIDGEGKPRMNLSDTELYNNTDERVQLDESSVYNETVTVKENPIINASVYK